MFIPNGFLLVLLSVIRLGFIIVHFSVYPVPNRTTFSSVRISLSSVYSPLILLCFNLLKAAELISMEITPVVLVSFSSIPSMRSWWNNRFVIVIYSLGCGVITGALHVFNVTVHIELILRGILLVWEVGYNIPFYPTTISRCLFLFKNSFSPIFIFGVIMRLFTGALIVLVEFWIALIIGQYISLCYNGLWLLILNQRKWYTNTLRSVPYLYLDILFLNSNYIRFYNVSFFVCSFSVCLVYLPYSPW